MWEWYTTKPFLNEVRFIGSVPTPWPSWAIAASTSFLSSSPDSKATLRTFLSSLEAKVRDFDSPEKREKDDVDYVMNEFGYPEEDVKAWLSTVGYFHTLEGMDEEMVKSTLRYVRDKHRRARDVQRPGRLTVLIGLRSAAARSRRLVLSRLRHLDGSSGTRLSSRSIRWHLT